MNPAQKYIRKYEFTGVQLRMRRNLRGTPDPRTAVCYVGFETERHPQ